MTDDSSPTKGKKSMVVVMRTNSAVIFKPEDYLLLEKFNTAIGPVDISYKTHWITSENDVKLPGNLLIEVVGEYNDFEEALRAFSKAGQFALSIMALSSNAAIETPEIELGFETTDGVVERSFFQNYIPPDNFDLYFLRQINVNKTLELIKAVLSHKDFGRIYRSIEQYNLALNSWGLGTEIIANAHLWMAVEALTKAKIRSLCEASNFDISDEAGLANQLGIDKGDLDSTIRRDFILQGDTQLYKEVKDASDGFEHGYKEFTEIQQLVISHRIKFAEYVRKSILELCELDTDIHSRLIKKPFNEPIGYRRVAKYIRSKLCGEGNELAADGKLYPYLQWSPIIESSHFDENGNFIMTPHDSCTLETAEGISMTDIVFEAWKPG